ncbi:MAG: insulinase family protein [Dysgonamonadaceae bacterium]|jgi:predicted Zn-dependent peptidase|nr:insulinase family protein [Dysgonamonadaceae bacterium]
MQYETFSLENKLRVIHFFSNSPVSYCGFAVNAGTRDEEAHQQGLAHFIEHMLFKGTHKRKAWHILNRMENVGGELNAYTTKEETFLYAVCLSENIERAIELLSDLIFNSRFPEMEIDKEKEVVFDEINSYRDNPSEMIFDEFENLLFKGNEMGHNILGEETSLNTFTQASCNEFTSRFYHPENMIFFHFGQMPLPKIIRLARKYFQKEKVNVFSRNKRRTPEAVVPVKEIQNKGLHQSHVIVGGRGYSIFDTKKTGLYLLNNIIGGPGMNSRLNVNLRERNGLVYTVESGLTSYTDTGVFTIYFGCDHKEIDKCLVLIYKELKKLRDIKLTSLQLQAAVKQLKGQLGIASDHRENIAMGLGKSFLHFNKYDGLPEVYRKIDALTASQLLDIANEIWDESQLFHLIYK